MADWAVDLLQYGLIGWFGVLLGVICLRMLQGRMRLSGMLADHVGGGIDVERVQAMAVFCFVVSAYLLEGLHMLENMPPPPPEGQRLSMPDISESLLVLLTGSNGVYLAGKIAGHRQERTP